MGKYLGHLKQRLMRTHAAAVRLHLLVGHHLGLKFGRKYPPLQLLYLDHFQCVMLFVCVQHFAPAVVCLSENIASILCPHMPL